ncbi:flagellar biosynthesis protein FlhB [Legionella quateirensis]|uniref:Flagellar biosynthetic protein FlhB n=1 Tax=Legionella quateirensis TaxID=45072 RepID=A0A378KSM7_9GAMM|nr:flagellar biosynthesis protein FlhB [Legionella quateirensis]KTD51191.1 flagellar biosynthetic protein FlhB [Legionella quateirensis]STY17565.1 flagellar biosynthetic protein FlhB [Legionella quateirensis]
MAEEEQAQEKTEQPSAKRLKESREKGQVARSKDFNATVILLCTGVGFLIFGKQLSYQLIDMMRQAFEFDAQILLTPTVAFERLYLLAKSGLWSLVPILVVIFLLSLGAPLLMGGWVFSGQALQPKFSRLNGLKGLKRMVSLKGLVEMLKSFFKFILVASFAILVLKTQIPALLALGNASVETAIGTGAFIIIKSFVLISASLILIAAVDVPFQLYEHSKAMKMTKQELKDEYKETEGKPEIKSAIRRAQHEIARRRMMNEVPKADVILTNPTHYAVAISYKKKGNKAPVVVAKGKDLIAFQISKVAKSHRVPIIAVPSLARAIYFSTKLNSEIPRGLYVAVAQVLAYVFQLKDRQHYDYKPEILQNVPIPPELVREAEEDI